MKAMSVLMLWYYMALVVETGYFLENLKFEVPTKINQFYKFYLKPFRLIHHN